MRWRGGGGGQNSVALLLLMIVMILVLVLVLMVAMFAVNAVTAFDLVVAGFVVMVVGLGWVLMMVVMLVLIADGGSDGVHSGGEVCFHCLLSWYCW